MRHLLWINCRKWEFFSIFQSIDLKYRLKRCRLHFTHIILCYVYSIFNNYSVFNRVFFCCKKRSVVFAQKVLIEHSVLFHELIEIHDWFFNNSMIVLTFFLKRLSLAKSFDLLCCFSLSCKSHKKWWWNSFTKLRKLFFALYFNRVCEIEYFY